MKVLRLVPFLFILTFSNTSLAQPQKEWKFSIGPAFILKNNLRLNNTYSRMDKDINYRFIPFVDGRYNRFSLGQNGLSFRAVGSFAIHANVFINIGGDKYKSQQMDTRYSSAFAGINLKFLKHQLTISRDIQSRSKAMEFKYSFSKMHILSEKWILINNLSLSFHDNKYANYYYGVKESEALIDRPAFTAKGYFTPSIGFLPIYKFSEHFTGTIGTFFKYIPQKITSSPTMSGKQIEISTIWGMSYNL